MTTLIYATTNPGKFEEVNKLFAGHGLTLHSPTEYGVQIKVAETGSSLEENAILKAEAYRETLPAGCVVLGDDTGVEIEALGGEPGIRVRRWKGYSMTDQEIIDYCLERLQGVSLKARTARFRTVIAVAANGQETKLFSGTLPGHIVAEPIPLRIKGFPFESLLYVDEYLLMLGEIHQLPISDKLKRGIITHREKAIIASLDYLRRLTAQG